jgi:hypothetical protein
MENTKPKKGSLKPIKQPHKNINNSLEVNNTAAKHIKELKDNYVFKKLKETIKDLKISLEKKETELFELKNNVKATTFSKLEREYKAKIGECQLLKEENYLLKETLYQ